MRKGVMASLVNVSPKHDWPVIGQTGSLPGSVVTMIHVTLVLLLVLPRIHDLALTVQKPMPQECVSAEYNEQLKTLGHRT